MTIVTARKCWGWRFVGMFLAVSALITYGWFTHCGGLIRQPHQGRLSSRVAR
jgi:hypothetical protein